MIKALEMADPKSCFNKADMGEIIFVLRAKDPAAPHAIREWARKRILLGKNAVLGDPQILEAIECADNMETWKKENDPT